MPRKKVIPTEEPGSAIARREGTTPNGGKYRLAVFIGEITVNGKILNNEAAADAICDQMTKALEQNREKL